MSDELLLQDENGVRHLILNRPQKINAIDYAQHLRLMDAFKQAEADEEVAVVALSGVGRGFCAGDDLTSGTYEGKDPYSHRKVDLEMGSGPVVLLESCAVLRRLSKPTIALMHNIALGSGYDYSLSCDFRIVNQSIRYGDPRIDRALWAAEGWSYKLPRLIHQSPVTPIAYLGELMNGAKALEYGLVHEVVADDTDVRESSRGFVGRLLAISGPAYTRTKLSMLQAMDASFQQTQLMDTRN